MYLYANVSGSFLHSSLYSEQDSHIRGKLITGANIQGLCLSTTSPESQPTLSLMVISL